MSPNDWTMVVVGLVIMAAAVTQLVDGWRRNR